MTEKQKNCDKMERHCKRRQIMRDELQGKRKEPVVMILITFVFYLAHAATAFVAAYLKERGMDAGTVGLIAAMMNCAGILSAPLFGALADKSGSSRKMFLKVLCAASLVMGFFLFLGKANTVTIPACAALILWAALRIPVSGLLDTWTVRRSEQTGRYSFGSIRLVGSISGATMCILYGLVAQHAGSNGYVLAGYSLFGGLAVVLTAVLTRRYDDETERALKTQRHFGAILKQKGMIRFFLCHAVMGLPIYCLNTFLPYKLSEIGAAASVMGVLIAVKAYTEVPMLLVSKNLLARVRPQVLMESCYLVFFAEHLVCALTDQVWLIAAVFMLHGLFFGLYLTAMMQYLVGQVPQQMLASAQSLSGSVTLICAVAGSIFCGQLVRKLGSGGFFFVTAGLFAVVILLFLPSVLRKKEV